MKEMVVVLYPSPCSGHLMSMVELAKLILHRHPNLSTTILTVNPPFYVGNTAPYIAYISNEFPDIAFLELSPPEFSVDHSLNLETLVFEFIHDSNPSVSKALESICEQSNIVAFIMDLFCMTALDVANDMHIPAHVFYTSSAADLAIFLYTPTLHSRIPISFRDQKELLIVPGLPLVPPTSMPDPLLDRTNKAYDWFVKACNRIALTQGILVNSFDELEPPRALLALAFGECTPDVPTPPVYCIGPLIAASTSGGDDDCQCLEWLRVQPAASVVYLCFGSQGTFSPPQIKEIAIGLENSRQRFLWVIHSTRLMHEPDLDALLPEGFLGRTAELGMVMTSWAPQVAVLNHPAVGGFVTHCGWNSALESVCAGVPMLAWPLYAEQHLNALFMVEEMKIAMAMEIGDSGFVDGGAVARCVKGLMESEKGNMLRDRSKALKEKAATALSEGGTSRLSLDAAVEAWLGAVQP
ncbi:hypothetical protein AMTRI_Chr07g30620 [Amborella trichopoda]